MNDDTIQGGMIGERLAMRLQHRGASRLLHVSRILRAREILALTDQQLVQLRDNRVELAQKLIKLTAEIRTVRFNTLNTLAIQAGELRAPAQKRKEHLGFAAPA
jgi:hypothetical protein